jgi:catalase
MYKLDFHHIDLLAHFGRERIPERVVRRTLE